jgi:hypothetical protein
VPAPRRRAACFPGRLHLAKEIVRINTVFSIPDSVLRKSAACCHSRSREKGDLTYKGQARPGTHEPPSEAAVPTRQASPPFSQASVPCTLFRYEVPPEFTGNLLAAAWPC